LVLSFYEAGLLLHCHAKGAWRSWVTAVSARLCEVCLEYDCVCTTASRALNAKNTPRRTSHIDLGGVRKRLDLDGLPKYLWRHQRVAGFLSDRSTLVAVNGQVLLRDTDGEWIALNSEVLIEKLTAAHRIATAQRVAAKRKEKRT
jgi:hypothetical protein